MGLSHRFPRGLYSVGLSAVFGSLYHAGLNHWFNEWARTRDGGQEAPRWASELYQVSWIVLELLGLSLVPVIIKPLTALALVLAFLALYRVLELLVFTLRWVFVAKEIRDAKRALFGFLLNFLEVGALSTILNVSVGCAFQTQSWHLTYRTLAGLFRLTLPASSSEGAGCNLLAHAYLFQAVILLLLIVAAVVGALTQESGDAA